MRDVDHDTVQRNVGLRNYVTLTLSRADFFNRWHRL